MPQPDDNPADRGRLWLTVTAVVAAVCLVAAVVATSLWLGERNAAASVRADRASATELDASYRDFATTVMTKLMTIRQETLSEDVDEIVGLIDGDFSEQFAPRRDSYEDVVKTTNVVADGVVSAAAVEHSYPDRAEVIMAIDQTIGNPKSDEDQDRQYRVRVTVNRHDDGEMKVTGVNFIP
ncbi:MULTISPECIES: hypothetical protein [Dietzia]|uniref:Mammalian cell entry protein n=1 Tax=Dietzia maris TaxID=37915 RepID=A0AAE4QWN3_9ACTN|nr:MULTISPECIES: hypothetical protein [Dietzia]MDV6299746.1 hypothetical protein [Dietzia maris]HMT49390.1 hypothetical protein [Dietzia sp.]